MLFSDIRSHGAEATSINFLLTELGGEELLHKFVDEEWKRLTA